MKRLANLFLVLAVIITIGSNISFAKAEDYSQQETIEAIRQSFIKVGNEALLKQVKSIIQTSPWVEENPSGAYPIGNKVEVDLIFDFDGVCTKQPTTFIRLNLGGMLSEDVMMFDSQDSVDFDCGALAAEAASDAQQKAEELAAELRRQAEEQAAKKQAEMLAKIKAKQEEQKSKSSAKSAKQALATYEEAFDKWFLGQANEYVEYIEEAVSVLGVVKDPPAFSPELREVGLIVKLRSGLCGRLEFSVLDSSATTSQSNPDGDPIVVSALDELSLEYSQVATNQPCPEGSRDGISELPVDASLTDKLIRDMRYVTDQLGYPEFYTMDLVITDTHENFGELKDGLLKYDVIDVTALVRDHKGRCFRTKQNLKYITKGPKSAIAKHLYNDSEMDIRTFNLTGDRFHEGNQLKCPIERELGQVDGQKNASLAIDFTEAEREVREYYKRMRPEDIVVRLLPENTGDPFVHNQLNGEENYAERRVNFLVVRTNRRCELVDLLFRVPLIYDVTALEGYRKVGDFRLHSGAGWGNEVSCAQWGVSDQLLDQAEEAFIKAASWSKEKQAIAAMNRAFAIVSTATVGMKAEELVSELKETLYEKWVDDEKVLTGARYYFDVAGKSGEGDCFRAFATVAESELMSRGKLAPIEVLAKSVTIHRKNCGEIETLEKQRRKISLSQFITQMKNNKEQFRDFADTIGAELSPTHNWGSFGHNVGLSWRFEPNSGEAVGIPEERQVYVRLAYTNALGLSSIGDCHSTPILIAEVYSIEGQFLRQTVEAQGDGEDKDQRECIRAGLNQGQIKFQDISEAALVELVKTKAKEVHWVGFQQPFAWKTGKPNSDGSWQREAKSAVVGLAGDGSCRQFKFRIIDKFHDETEMLERIVKLNVPTKASCASLGL